MGKISRQFNKVRAGGSASARVLKAVSVFGSLQVLTLLCSVIRTKLVALWIGPSGVGLLALFSSTAEMLTTAGTLNLRQSAVRHIAASPAPERANTARAVVRISAWLGILGTIAMALLSPLLSRITFGSYAYTWHFVLLSAAMFAVAVAAGRQAVLQAFDRLSALARIGLWQAVCGSGIAVAMFWLWGVKAIVPVLLGFYFCSLLFSTLWSEKLPSRPPLSRRNAFASASPALRLGFFMTLAGSAGMLADYLLRVYLNYSADSAVVGQYQAGYTIVNSYVGMLFTAMAMEYYPRISAQASHRWRLGILASHESVFLLWILMPVSVILISAAHLAVGILYSPAFGVIVPYIVFAVTGMALKAVAVCAAYVLLARGDGRTFVVTESLGAAATLVCGVVGWHMGGFSGMGIAFVVEYALYSAAVTALCYFRGIRFAPGMGRMALLALGVGAMAVAARMWLGWWGPLALVLPWLLPLSVHKILTR